jgi:cupin superfamily acireductone dioxygenase involved in methionine salvage
MMMMLFVAQNKRRSNVHKENNTKIENIERYKNFTHCDKLSLIKKISPRPNNLQILISSFVQTRFKMDIL